MERWAVNLQHLGGANTCDIYDIWAWWCLGIHEYQTIKMACCTIHRSLTGPNPCKHSNKGLKSGLLFPR